MDMSLLRCMLSASPDQFGTGLVNPTERTGAAYYERSWPQYEFENQIDAEMDHYEVTVLHYDIL